MDGNWMSAGFYKYEELTLHHGPNYVLAPEYELLKETKDDHTYPIDGWYWFDSIEEAREFYNIPAPIIEESETSEEM
jgi:hypothetical protein